MMGDDLVPVNMITQVLSMWNPLVNEHLAIKFFLLKIN